MSHSLQIFPRNVRTWQAVTVILVDLVHTGGPVGALGLLTLVDVDLAVLAFEARDEAGTVVVTNLVLAHTAVDAGILAGKIRINTDIVSERSSTRVTLVDLLLTSLSGESNITFAEEAVYFIFTRRIIFAWIVLRNRSCKTYNFLLQKIAWNG